MKLLEHTPFPNYLLPGIVLLLINGILSIIVFIAVVMKFRRYADLIMLEGALLLSWILIQMAWIRMVFFLHYVLGGTALLLILSGWWLRRFERHSQNN